jgi:hypothetical protein
MATVTLPQELRPALPRRRPTHSSGQLVVFARAIAAIVAALRPGQPQEIYADGRGLLVLGEGPSPPSSLAGRTRNSAEAPLWVVCRHSASRR